MPTDPPAERPTKPPQERPTSPRTDTPVDLPADGTARVAIIGALLTGVFVAVQSRVNGELAGFLGAPIEAALVSFGTGLLLCLLVAVLVPRTRAGLRSLGRALRSGALRPYLLFGGVLGGLFVAVQTSAVPVIGVAVFTVVALGGQTLSALLVDRLGIGPGGRSPITTLRVIAAVVAIVGVSIAATARSGHASFALLPVLLTFGVGVFQAVQQATNGRVNRASGFPMSTTLVNFVLGTVTLVVIAALEITVGGVHLHPLVAAPWWAWIGGACGIGFIALAAFAVRHLGVLVFGLISLASQLVTALVLDLLSPSTRGQVGSQLILGLVITLVASAIAAYARDR